MNKRTKHTISKKRVSTFTYPFFIIALFVIYAPTYGQWQEGSKSYDAYQLVLSLKLNRAESVIDSSTLPADIFINHFSKAIRAVVNEKSQAYNSFEKYHENSFDLISEMNENSPYRNFYLADMLLQATIVHLKYGEEWNAMLSLRKAYSLIESNTEKYPDFLPNKKTFGLIHIIIGSVPTKYHWVLTFIGFEGEVQQGFEELSQLAVSNNEFNTEAKLLLAFVHAYLLQDASKGADILELLYKQHSNNLLFEYMYASVLIKNAQSDVALKIINNALLFEQEEQMALPILEYLKAEILLQKGNYSSSISWYQHFIKIQNGTNFIKDSYYKIGMNYLLLGEKEQTKEFYEMTKIKGTSSTDIDRYADRQSSNDLLPNPTILRMRYATDGGYYKRVEEIIEQVGDFTFATKKNNVEYNYRKARYYHKINKNTVAIALYKITINGSSKEDWYFAPNSALQLGYIYKNQGDNKQAIKYLKLALSYRKHEYKKSIDYKANTSLKELIE